MAKTLVVIALVLVVALGIFLIANTGKSNSNVTGNVVAGSANSPGSADTNVKTFDISAKNFRFYMNGVESPELRVNQGDKVQIVFTNEEGFHDFVIDEFSGARTKQIKAPATETIRFVADKKGTFEYYCSVGQHRAMGMKGTFIVQ